MNESLVTLIDRYVTDLRRSGHRHRTIVTNRRQLDRFAVWAQVEGVNEAGQLTLGLLDGYRDHLPTATSSKGYPLNRMLQRENLTKLRRFLSWLHRHGILNIDLSAGVPASCQSKSTTTTH